MEDYASLFPFLFGEGFGGGAGMPPPAPATMPPNPYGPPGSVMPEGLIGPPEMQGPQPPGLAGAPYQPPGSTSASVGGNMANAPMSLAPPNPGSMAAVPTSAALGQSRVADPNKVARAIQMASRGVQAAAPPAPQKVSTPHAPVLSKVGASDLINTLSSLGIGPQQAVGLMFGRRLG